MRIIDRFLKAPPFVFKYNDRQPSYGVIFCLQIVVKP